MDLNWIWFLPKWLDLLSSSLRFLKSITLEQSCCIDCSVPRDTKSAKICLSAGLGVFFLLWPTFLEWGYQFTWKIFVIKSLGTLCWKYCQYWAVKPQSMMSLWLGWASRKQSRATSEPCLPFVRRLFESSIFSWNVLLFWLSHFWQTDAETKNLQPNLVITTWFYLKHLRNLPHSFLRSCKTASLTLSSFLELKKVVVGNKHNF